MDYEQFTGEVNSYCELCGNLATSYCQADEASLCDACDIKVHSANFLVTRHIRFLLCRKCPYLTRWRKCGIEAPRISLPYCESCLSRESTCQINSLKSNSQCQLSEECCSRLSSESSNDVNGVTWRSGIDLNLPPFREVEQIPSYECDSQSAHSDKREQCNSEFGQQNFRGEDVNSPASVLSSEKSLVRKQGHGSNKLENHLNPETSMDPQEECASSNDYTSFVNSPLKRRKLSISSHSTVNLEDYFIIKPKTTSSATTESALSQRHPSTSSSTPDDLPDTTLSISHTSQPSETVQNSHAKTRPLGDPAAARLQRVLSTWHTDLALEEPGTAKLAFRMFCRVLQGMKPKSFVPYALRIILATCLWMSAKLEEKQMNVPKASEVASATGVSASQLISAETQLLSLLDWKVLGL